MDFISRIKTFLFSRKKGASQVSKIIGVTVALIVLTAMAPTVVANIVILNTSLAGWSMVSGLSQIILLFFVLGAGVILVGKELGIIKL